jgi:putative glutamine amidotransferase
MKHHGQARRPSIAITPDLSSPTPEAPHPNYELRSAYADAVLRAGGLPFILPYSDDRSILDNYLDRISAVVISGGAFDVPPELYGETAGEGLGVLKPARTTFELTVLRIALARKMPVLGVCGGMQLINVAFGGTLIQDLALEHPDARSHQQKHDRSQPQHPVEVKDQTQLAECVGRGQLMVNSTHHQAIKKLGEGLIVSATAPDGVIEAIEGKDGFVLGVQWHPELMLESVPPNLGVYRTLITRARDRRY